MAGKLMMNFEPNDEEIKFIDDSLRKFNDERVGPDNHKLLNIVEYDENKNIIGGLLGGTYWGWLYIDILFVDEKHRKNGTGTKLIKAAEEEAVRRGCHSVHVDTMSWQVGSGGKAAKTVRWTVFSESPRGYAAKAEFYKKLGYRIISELDDIPMGNKKFHLVKDLA